MTENFGQSFDTSEPIVSSRNRHIITIAFDLFFPTAIVTISLLIGHLFFRI